MKAARVRSLDAFRGLAIVLMLIVNNPGNEAYALAPLKHADWFGCTLADLAFPFFIFIMGAAVPLSVLGRLKKGMNKRQIFIQALGRSLILVSLGATLKALDWFVYRDFFRPYGVLQRIAFVYLALVIIVMIFPRYRLWACISVGLLLLYLLILSCNPFTGTFQELSLDQYPLLPEKYHNTVDVIDTRIFGDHLYNYDKDLHMGHDPEGLLSTIPSISTGLFGVLCSAILFRRRTKNQRTVVYLMLVGVVLIVSGFLSQGIIPFCKNLWTPSFALYTAGWAYLVFSLLYWVIDLKGLQNWAIPLIMYGQNPIAIYFAAESIPDLFDIIRWTGPDGNTVYLSHYLINLMLNSWATPIFGPYVSSEMLCIVYLVAFGALAWWLAKHEIFIKI